MDASDHEFIHQLFKENSSIRSKHHLLAKEQLRCEALEEELRSVRKIKPESPNETLKTDVMEKQDSAKAPVSINSTGIKLNGKKELDDALVLIDKLNSELALNKNESIKLKSELQKEIEKTETLEATNSELKDLMLKERWAKEEFQMQLQQLLHQTENVDMVSPVLVELQQKLNESEKAQASLRLQMKDIAEEANRIQNNQQIQLQGIQIVMDTIKIEYDLFLQSTKLEYEAFKTKHVQQFDQLKNDLDSNKWKHFEEKKYIALEYQSMLTNMQAQFEDYRKTTEFLISAELVKMEDELTSQAQRYEQEIMYVVQAKDKFYTDLMVAKDSKIMALIEGSDLQSIMQKHELEIEGIRKIHAKEIELVKSDQEVESKNIINLLQRQNGSLESKCEKLQSHQRIIDSRIKELTSTIDQKTMIITDRDETILSMETEYQMKIQKMTIQMDALTQEKEHLRHKVIRLNLDARGEGENTIQNMIKRITRETSDLQNHFEQLGSKYEKVLIENQNYLKKSSENQQIVKFLEKQVKTRTEEYDAMTKTFEKFLEGRARQFKNEKLKNSTKLTAVKEQKQNTMSTIGNAINGPHNVVKVIIPEKKSYDNLKISNQKSEIDRGFSYLQRFKGLSKAFATGELKVVPQDGEIIETGIPGPWEKTVLYSKLQDATNAMMKLYKDPRHEKSEAVPVDQTAYEALEAALEKKMKARKDVKLYKNKMLALEDLPRKKNQSEGLSIGGHKIKKTH